MIAADQYDRCHARQGDEKGSEVAEAIGEAIFRALIEIARNEDQVRSLRNNSLDRSSFVVTDPIGLKVGDHRDTQRCGAGPRMRYGYGRSFGLEIEGSDQVRVPADRPNREECPAHDQRSGRALFSRGADQAKTKDRGDDQQIDPE